MNPTQSENDTDRVVPNDADARFIFQTASSLHEQTLRHTAHHAATDMLLSVYDILQACKNTANILHRHRHVEIEGSFDEQLLRSFQADMHHARDRLLSSDSDPRYSLLQKEPSAHVYSFADAMQQHVGPNTAAVVTIEDNAHSVALFHCADGRYALFDPLPGHVMVFADLDRVLGHMHAQGFRSQFTMYCIEHNESASHAAGVL